MGWSRLAQAATATLFACSSGERDGSNAATTAAPNGVVGLGYGGAGGGDPAGAAGAGSGAPAGGGGIDGDSSAGGGLADGNKRAWEAACVVTLDRQPCLPLLAPLWRQTPLSKVFMIVRPKHAGLRALALVLSLPLAAAAVTQPNSGVVVPVLTAGVPACADKNVEVCLDLVEDASFGWSIEDRLCARPCSFARSSRSLVKKRI